MRIRAWPHGRIANRSGVKRKQRVVPQREVVERGQFHEEIVRVLAVINRLAESRFTLLEQKWIETLGHGCRFQAEHSAECKLAVANLALRHGHEPVGGKNLVVAARAALL